MELSKYYYYYLKSYLISFFFFKNYNSIIFIKNFKIIINLNIVNSSIFFYFLIFFLFFNDKFWFLINKSVKFILIKLKNFKLFNFLQSLSILFLPSYNRSFNVNFNINSNLNVLNLILLNFSEIYINKNILFNSFFLNNFKSFFFFFFLI